MSDFFREVDEELRNERMKSLWSRYGFVIIGAAVMLVVGTAAYRGYIYWQEQQAAASGDQFVSAVELLSDGKTSEATTILNDLKADGSGKYPMLAQFRLASLALKDGDKGRALETYEALASSNEVPADLQDFASLQAAMIAVDTESYDAIKARVAGLILDENPWRYLAREALALSAWRANDLEETAKWVSEIKSAGNLPQGLRQRIQILEELIISRGGELPLVDAS